MSEEKRMINIHYNVFETIEEQMERQKYKCKRAKFYDEIKDNIIFLYVHNILTDSEEEKCFNRLHKQIIESVRKENKL